MLSRKPISSIFAAVTVHRELEENRRVLSHFVREDSVNEVGRVVEVESQVLGKGDAGAWGGENLVLH